MALSFLWWDFVLIRDRGHASAPEAASNDSDGIEPVPQMHEASVMLRDDGMTFRDALLNRALAQSELYAS